MTSKSILRNDHQLYWSMPIGPLVHLSKNFTAAFAIDWQARRSTLYVRKVYEY
jgi:hypothetical protein